MQKSTLKAPTTFKIFIDANIYLDFYSTILPKLQNLLPTLDAARDHIVVPRQVVNEVKRNSIQQVAAGLSEFLEKVKPVDAALPTQHDVVGSNNISDWNKSFNTLLDARKELENQAKELVDSILTSVQQGNDPVSLKLGRLFENAVEPSGSVYACTEKTRMWQSSR